ncbi:MAG: ABC-2 family transporter protein [Lachnospiraceae bacterium]|nr:ABC-2 family transporter protein [Lachnospiraceae bacterium]
MKKYQSFFRLRFQMGLQYRAAAVAGMVTQFFWGFMLIIAFRAFYEADPTAFPMTFQDTVSYIWLQQAFLALFNTWMMENEIFDTIANGNIAYELCRPIRIYNMWIARSLANRFSRAVLRCSPILIVAFLVPAPYRMGLPPDLGTFLLFVLSLILGTAVATAFCMIVYGLTFFTISPQGVRTLFASLVDFLAGGVIPIPFMPDKVRTVVELLPFASMQNAPLRIYSGSMPAEEIRVTLFLQFFWLIALVLIGSSLCRLAERKACIQGG